MPGTQDDVTHLLIDDAASRRDPRPALEAVSKHLRELADAQMEGERVIPLGEGASTKL